MLPTVEDILEGKVNVDLDASLLENWMSQELFDVYSLPLLTNEVRMHHPVLFFLAPRSHIIYYHRCI